MVLYINRVMYPNKPKKREKKNTIRASTTPSRLVRRGR